MFLLKRLELRLNLIMKIYFEETIKVNKDFQHDSKITQDRFGLRDLRGNYHDAHYVDPTMVQSQNTPFALRNHFPSNFEPEESLFKEFLHNYKLNRNFNTAGSIPNLYSGWRHHKQWSLPRNLKSEFLDTKKSDLIPTFKGKFTASIRPLLISVIIGKTNFDYTRASASTSIKRLIPNVQTASRANDAAEVAKEDHERELAGLKKQIKELELIVDQLKAENSKLKEYT